MILGPAFERLLAEVEQDRERRLFDEYQRGIKAMRLAPTLEICRALLRGESVPVSCLDQEWFVRLGGRRR